MFSRTKKKDKKQPVGPERDVSQSSALILPEDLQVIRDLGEGHYGVVQLGKWNPKDGRPESDVAIKSLKNTAVDGVLKCVLEEARTMQKLSHEFIVKMYGISLPFKEEPLKLVTEYASYGSLEENLKKKDRDVCRVSALSKFAYQVAQGMDYLAKLNLVHRDLSTRNILVFDLGLVKISDFGLARTLDEGAATQITVHRKLAVAWLPPEAIVDNVFTRWSDVWSYGITLWEMFSFGQQPWAELSLNQIKIMIANEPRNHLKKPGACPDGFYEIMLDCWERNQEERPTFDKINKKVLELQPREGITKVCHRTGEAGHLSYDSKRKVTVISKREEGLLLVQSENGSIGLVHEKNLDFSKRALQKRVSGRNAGDSTRPNEAKKQKSTDLFTKLHKATNKAVVEEDAVVRKPQTQTEENGMARDLIDLRDDANSDPTNPLSPTRYTGNLGTNHERMPQATKENQALEPKPQGATPDHVIAQSRPGSGYISMDYHQRNPAANEDEYVTFKEEKGPQDMMARAHRSLSESPALGPTSDGDSGVLYQQRQGPKYDTLLRRGPQDIPGANTLDRNCRPDIPDRPDLQEHTGITSGAVGSVLSTSAPSYSPFATTPRKTSRRPVPTPRRNTKARPASDGSLDRKAVRNGKEVLPENGDFQALNKSETAKSCDTGGVVGASADKNEPPPIPLPYQPTRTSLERQELAENIPVRSELRLEGQKGDNKELQVEFQDQTSNYDAASEQPMKKKHYIIIGEPIPNGEGTAQASASQDSNGQDVLNESQAPAADQVTGATSCSDSFQPTEDRHFVNADEVKRLSADFADLSLNPEDEPIYDKPIQLPDPPYISKEILNQPPPSPSKLFGGTFREDLDTSFQLPPGGWDDNSAFHPFYQPPLQGYSPEEPVNPVDQPVYQTDQYVNPGGETSEGAYGEEIDAGIREIREIFGEEVPLDWCYAALLQFQGDVNQVVRVIKIQKLSKLTGKSEPFCERTLSHCSWNLDRAASYIFENFEDKDV